MAKLGQPLTARQQEIWDMFRPVDQGGQGQKKDDVARVLGISVNVVSKTLTVIRKKLGVVGAPGGGNVHTAEAKNPEAAAAAIVTMTDPYMKVEDAMKASGLPQSTVTAIMKRLRAKYNNVGVEVKNLQTRELSDLIGKKIHLMLQYLDDKVVADASARDLAMGIAQLTEKRQLLRGEPTQIVSDHERAKLHELMPALMREANRRGVTLDGQVTEKTVNPA